MNRRGDRLLVGAGLVLIVGAGVVLVEVFLLPPAKRNDVVGLGGFVLALAGAVVSVLAWLRRVRRPVDPRPLNTLACLLAQGVHGQWRKAATERVLLTPAPIPVRWSLSSLPVTGDLTATLDGPFNPLPGLTAVTEGQMRAGGGRRELFAVYAGLASGRIVVVGAPGSGKTGSAILLLLDALEHREQVDDTNRARIPVPVLFTAHGWDPTTCSVGNWLADQLATTYPMFQHRGGQVEAAALVAAGAVALILDGFDEMNEAARPAALQALSDAAFRVVVLTRGQEMLQATGDAWLVGAAALRLHDVAGPEGADYLQRARTGPPPSGWSQLLTHLREYPGSVLASGLSTPLPLSLIRDTYGAADDVSELLDARICGTADDLEQHLITRVLPVAYTPRPGRSKPRYSLPQATQVLTFIARQMNHDHTRDLAWWDIPRWTPTSPRILVSTLAGGLVGGLLGGLAFLLLSVQSGFAAGIVGVLVDMLLGFAVGLGIGLPFGLRYGRGGRAPKRVKNWRAIRLRLVLTAGLVYGLAGGFASGVAIVLANQLMARFLAPSSLMYRPATLLLFGLMFGLLLVPVSGLIEGEGRSQEPGKIWRNGGVFGLVLGLLGLVIALTDGYGLQVGLISFLLFGLVGGLMGGLAGMRGGLAGGLVEGEERPRGPRESWRNDRMVGLVFGLVIALSVSLGFVLATGLVVWYTDGDLMRGFAVGLGLGPRIGLTLGLVCGITSSATWPTTLAWFLLRLFRVPAVGMMPFLEDARTRDVLRTVGAVYQFRHAILQDHLAAQATLRHTASPAIQSSL